MKGTVLSKKCSIRPLALAVAASLYLGSGTAVADTTEDLLNMLKAKGVLTKDEYDVLTKRVQTEKKQQREEAKKAAVEESQKAAKAAMAEGGKKPDPTDVKVSFKNGFVIQTADGKNSLAIKGRIQADNRDYLDGDGKNTDVFELRRAYLYAMGKVFDKYEFMMLGNFSGTPQAVFWYMNAHWWDEAQLEFGQFRFPFGQNEWTSSRNIDFMERALPMQFVTGIDRGVMLHGLPLSGMYYGLAGVNGGLRTNAGLNGSGLSENNDTDGKGFIGHLSFNAAEPLGHKDNIYYLGASYSIGTEATDTSPPTNSPNYQLQSQTEGRGLVFFRTENFNENEVDLWRAGVSNTLSFGPIKFTGEYVHNTYSGKSKAGLHFNRDIDAYYVSTNWLITGEKYGHFFGKNGAFGIIEPKQNFDMAGGWGAWELGLRYSHLDATDFNASNPVGTGVLRSGFANSADAWTVGLKWIVNPNTRFLLNYIRTAFNQPVKVNATTTTDVENALNFRTQLDF